MHTQPSVAFIGSRCDEKELCTTFRVMFVVLNYTIYLDLINIRT